MSNILRRSFVDIVNGYSSMKLNGENIYIRHLSHREHLLLDDLESEFKAQAENSGLPNAAHQLEYIKREGLWSDKKEADIEGQKVYIGQLNVNKKNISLPSVLENFLKQIKEAEEKLKIMEQERRELIGFTSESYASKLMNEYYIMRSLFKDKELSTNYFTEDEFNDIEDDQLGDIVQKYNENLECCSDINIKKLSIQSFFQEYYFLCGDDFKSFYGRNICDFTYFQVKLANYSKYFKYIYENNDLSLFPQEIREDPDKLVAYIETTKKGKEMIDKEDGQLTSPVGMTKKDAEMMGINYDSKDTLKELEQYTKYFRR